ncbi:tryptophan--tRNA ligase [bacterium]|nr:tryptophan--tRNA ligase [bacterium]
MAGNGRKVLLSGMQPTGMLHLGNYEGALKNWVRLQNSGQYEIYYCIVDWHALTTAYEDPSELEERIYQIAADYIAAGLDPEKVTLFVQSDVKQHAELHLLLSMIVPIPWLERVPSYKEKVETLGLDSYGFLGYPLLQTADIIIYRADAVPVGKDQLPHLELAREIVRRFNYFYGDVFPEPDALLSEAPFIPGTDNRKMSKSYDNHICMGDPPDRIQKRVMSYYTDETKIYRGDAGHPDTCPVFALLKIYAPEETEKIKSECESGSRNWGCVKCKKLLAEMLVEKFASFRKKREELLADREQLRRILRDGAEKARARAEETMKIVRRAMKMWNAG